MKMNVSVIVVFAKMYLILLVWKGKNMKIIQVIPSLQIIGGAERFVIDLAIAQQNLGHDVLVISLYENGECYFEQDIIKNNLKVVFLNKKRGFD